MMVEAIYYSQLSRIRQGSRTRSVIFIVSYLLYHIHYIWLYGERLAIAASRLISCCSTRILSDCRSLDSAQGCSTPLSLLKALYTCSYRCVL